MEMASKNRYLRFLSTLSLRRATVLRNSHTYRFFISIHALLAESDRGQNPGPRTNTDFYPRSPCGERLWGVTNGYVIFYFYPRSPCGERQRIISRNTLHELFLSTLSLRRATGRVTGSSCSSLISIHALLAESDCQWRRLNSSINFYPRSPCGERRRQTCHKDESREFLSTLSLRRATTSVVSSAGTTGFLSTLSLRRATDGRRFDF